MGFREFITNRLFRRSLEAELDEWENIRPPANPSRRYINRLVERLLSGRNADAAQGELEMIGSAAVPSLVAVLRDRRYHEEVKRSNAAADQKLDLVLQLLVPHAAAEVIAAATPLARSTSAEIRKTAAIHLASLGCDDVIPLLAELLIDSDGYVRSYVKIGTLRALSDGRCSDRFRREMYDLLLAQCDQEWEGTVNDAAEAVVKLDPARAGADFASERWLSPSNEYVYEILRACNAKGISLPEAPVRRLLDHSLPQAIGEECYPNQYVAAGALESLARTIGEQIKPLLMECLNSDQEEIQESAAKGLALVAGLDDPVTFVLEQIDAVGFERLTPEQRIVYCAFKFDAEVCNGGLMQFFGNSSGNHAVETLEALRVLGHPAALRALESAMSQIGPLSRETDREMRLAAFEDRFDELQSSFKPLQNAYYGSTGLFRQRMLLYAVENAAHFRRGSKTGLV